MTAAVDGYCNFALSIPIEALWPAFKAKKPAFRARQVRHAQSTPWRRLQAQVMDSGPVQSFLTDGLRRTDRVQLLADPPDKAFGRHTARWIITAIASVHDATKTDLRQTTSYVVPGNTGLASVTGLARRGVDVSLVSTAD